MSSHESSKGSSNQGGSSSQEKEPVNLQINVPELDEARQDYIASTMKPKKALIVPAATLHQYGRLKRHDQIPSASLTRIDSWLDKPKI